MGLGLHNSNIASGVPVSISVLTGPVRGLFLDEGPHEVMHCHKLHVWLVQVIDLVDDFLYHEALTDLGTWTDTHLSRPWDQKCLLAPFAVPPKH